MNLFLRGACLSAACGGSLHCEEEAAPDADARLARITRGARAPPFTQTPPPDAGPGTPGEACDTVPSALVPPLANQGDDVRIRGAFMKREYYSDSITDFLAKETDAIVGALARSSSFDIATLQNDAWVAEVSILKQVLAPYRQRGRIYFEYAIPRLGRRIDVVVLIDHVVFVLEFKIGQRDFPAAAVNQVWDYALDLKNFHESSHDRPIAPVLVSSQAVATPLRIETTTHNDQLLVPIRSNTAQLPEVIGAVLLTFA